MRKLLWMAAAVMTGLLVGACTCRLVRQEDPLDSWAKVRPATQAGAKMPETQSAASELRPARVVAVAEPSGNIVVSTVAAAPANLPLVTLHLAGDSTVSNYDSKTPQEGWGQEIGQFFTDKVTVNNQ